MQDTPKISFQYSSTLILISAVSLCLGWQAYPIFLFVGFVPILMLEDYTRWRKWGYGVFLLFCLVIMLIWNIGVTWWLFNSSVFAALRSVAANALFMTVPWLAYRMTRLVLGDNYGYLTFVLYWLSIEYIHLHWEFAWAWLTLGNAFASAPYFIQWYEYTGTLGGSLWVLLINLLVYFIVKSRLKHNRRIYVIYTGGAILIPVIVSLIIQATYTSGKGKEIEVVAVQPNLNLPDPILEEKKSLAAAATRMKSLIAQAKTEVSPATRLLLFPELTFNLQYNEEEMIHEINFRKAHLFLLRYPDLAMLFGSSTSRFYGRSKATLTSGWHSDVNKYSDFFNSAVWLQGEMKLTLYHKSKLMPHTEVLPYPQIISLIFDIKDKYIGYGSQKERQVFLTQDSVRVAPLIGFESIYGDFAKGCIAKGAQAFAIISNNKWGSGFHQHFAGARLRAIENRRSVAFCANKGTAGFINQLGQVTAKNKPGSKAVVKQTLQANDKVTVYAQHGDYIGRLSAFVAVGLLLTFIVKAITRGRTGSFD